MTDLQIQAERLYNIRKYARESGIKTNRAEVSILTRFSISEQAELMDLVVRMELADMKVPAALVGREVRDDNR